MGYIAVFLLIGFIIFIHELGHFIAAKVNKIEVESFSLGFGPAVWQKKISSTVYYLRAIPMGGYVLPAVKDADDFFKIMPAKRIWFSLGGPAANFLLAFLFYVVLHLVTFSIDGLSPLLWPFALLSQSLNSLGQGLVAILKSLPLLFSHPQQISGIVGIVSLGGQSSLFTWQNFLRFAALLNLNLGVLNLLPLPALDGGKVVLYLLEKLHPAARRLQIPLSLFSWVLLLLLFVYTTGADIARLWA